MYCPNCGANVPSGDFCPSCGARVNQSGGAGNQAQQYPSAPEQGVQDAGQQNAGSQYTDPQYGGPQNAGPQYTDPQYGGPQNAGPQYGGPQYGGPQYGGPQYAGPQGPSYFDGTGAGYFGLFIVNALVLGVTCGIMLPWVVCRNLRWRKSHTVINGRRLVFTGTAAQLWGNWIKWWLLTLVTCGIYSFWVGVRMQEWEAAHTCYEGTPYTEGQTFDMSFYDATVGERLGVLLVSRLLVGLTCGIYLPWAKAKILKFDMEHTVINGERLGFKGTGAGYWGENTLVSLLCGITCGIYLPWGVCQINRWTYKNTFIQSVGNVKNPYN